MSHKPTSSARPVSQLPSHPVHWLWLGHLAPGKLTLMDGDPGLGKSLLTLDLCARLSTGRPWPDGTPTEAPASVIVLNGEDGEDDTLGPRLQALGADPERVFVLGASRRKGRSPLALPGRTYDLERALKHTGARLVVIDPLSAFVEPGVNLSSDASVRQALAPLTRLAERYRCAVQLVRHLNKSAGGRALYRGLGSIGLIAVCRFAWLVAADPRDPERRIFAQVKNNLTPPQPSLRFEIRGADGVPPTLHWLGPVAHEADSLIALPPTRSPRDCAREFLLDFLRGGPRTTREIWKQGEALGLIERTLRRAKDDLEIRMVESRVAGRRATYWLLPGQELPPGAVGHTLDPELRAAIEEMDRLYPPATPLDDVDTL